MVNKNTLELFDRAAEGDQERCQQLLIQGADVNGMDVSLKAYGNIPSKTTSLFF